MSQCQKVCAATVAVGVPQTLSSAALLQAAPQVHASDYQCRAALPARAEHLPCKARMPQHVPEGPNNYSVLNVTVTYIRLTHKLAH